MGTCGTGGGHGDVRPLQTLHDGEMTGHHIDDGGRHEEGSACGATVDQAAVVLFNQTQAADTGTDRHTDALGICLVDDETGIIQRLYACGDTVLDEEIHLASFFAVDTVLLGIEILTWPAKRVANSLASKCSMGEMPLCPLSRACQLDSAVLPTGESIPKPVTTTLRFDTEVVSERCFEKGKHKEAALGPLLSEQELIPD